MQEFSVVDPKKIIKRTANALVENLTATRKVEYRKRVMEGKVDPETRKKGTYGRKMDEWRKKKGLPPRRPPAICPKCNRNMSAELADKQIANNREGGVECLACIMGLKRKPLPQQT